ncbi:hypothetical protein BB734_02205, partial [Mycobacterium avium subsp. hominissuis]
MLGAAATAGGLSTYLNLRHTQLTAGRLVAEMDAREDLLTPFGNLHGGCLSEPSRGVRRLIVLDHPA